MARMDLGKVVPQKGVDYWTNADKQEIETDINNDIKDVDNLTNYYTKTEVDNKVSSVYKYKGTVATYNDLPTQNLTIGDVYNVETDGSNYAWTGTAWDKLGGDIDLSGYQTKIDSSHKLSSDLVDDENSTNKFVSSQEKNVWNNKSDFSGSYNDLNDKPTLFSGDYEDLTNKPTIPSALSDLSDDSTHRVVSDTEKTTWNNKGTYSKPANGIPKTDLASGVQSSLDKADSALQTHQDISGKLDTSKVKNANSTTAGDVYDVRYINSIIGDINTILASLVSVGGGN